MQLAREAERTCCQKVRDENETELYPVRPSWFRPDGTALSYPAWLRARSQCCFRIRTANSSGSSSRCIAGAHRGVAIQLLAFQWGSGVGTVICFHRSY